MITCPGCGEQNPDRFRLCGFCGTPLVAPVVAQDVRKTVTIVFSDLQGSTALGERLDSEALREVLARYFDEMRGALELHGGTVEKYIGDAVMAVFGLPTVREDDALRAVRAAFEMKRRLAGLNDELAARWGVTLTNRTGVNTGEVVAGEPVTGQRLVTGDPVNTAARLEQAAPPLEILLGEATYRHVRNAVDVVPVEPLELKGKAERTPAYRLVSVQATGQQERTRPTLFVGRDAELATLASAYEDAVSSGTSQAVTVLADAGVGKSRLMDEFVGSVGGDALVLSGRCLPYGRGITFWPLGEVVRRAAGIAEDDSADDAFAQLRRSTGDDEVAERLAAAIGLLDRTYPVEELSFAARRYFEQLARDRPLVVLWEDLHWAEATLLDLIDGVARNAAGPLLVLNTARPSFAEVWQRELPGRTIELGPLAPEAVGRFVDGLLGGAAGADAIRRQIVATAEGNPLFAEQMFSMLVDDGVLERTDGGWTVAKPVDRIAIPPTIDALLRSRLDALRADERAVVDVASVIGLEFAHDAVASLVPEDLRVGVAASLASLTHRRLIRRTRTHDEAAQMYRFDHILIRDAAYSGLLKRRRAQLHEQFALWGDAVNASRRRGVEYEEILGFHLEQAYRYLSELEDAALHRPLAERAASKLAGAGRRAFDREDMTAAANLLRRAHDLRAADDAERLELVPDLAHALTQTGDLAWAEVFLADAIETARRQGKMALAAEARLAQLTTLRFAGGGADNWSRIVLDELETSLPLFAQNDDHRRLARAWRLAVDAHGISYRFGDAAAAAQRAVRHAELGGDPRGAAVAASAYAMAAVYGPTPVDEAIARCEETLVQTASNRKVHAFVTLLMAPLYAMKGDFELARRLYADARATFEEIGATLYSARTSLASAVVETLAGDAAAAERELRRDYETLEQIGERYLRPTLAATLALVLCAEGRPGEASDFVHVAEDLAAEDDVETQALTRSAKAAVLAQTGDLAAADEAARTAVELLRRTDALVHTADALSVYASVLERGGRTADRLDALREAAALYARKGNVVAERTAQQALDREAVTPRV